ncbi:hypothetical protein [Timonella sp. A28]|uniref:hypothetical protein n=1 Tax=Timonella sp. A28 TaxID=3442640 RepID=UPI003EB89D01
MERWEQLFTQLESEFAFEELMTLHTAAAELSRAETSRISLYERLRADAGNEVELLFEAGRSLKGTLTICHIEWLLLTIAGATVIVPLASIVAVKNLTNRSMVEPAHDAEKPHGEKKPTGRPSKISADLQRISLNSVLRSIARDRSYVRVATRGNTLSGRIQRVGIDHFDVQSGGVGEWEERERTESFTLATSYMDYMTVA